MGNQSKAESWLVLGAAAAVLVGVSYMIGRRHQRDGKDKLEKGKVDEEHIDRKKTSLVVESLHSEFLLDTDFLKRIKRHMMNEMILGLHTSGKSSMAMFPTYVRHLPTGEESGEFLALDLGGSNFRVLHLKLDGKGGCISDSKKYVIPQKTMTGTGEALFDFIADCVADFVPHTMGSSNPLPLGFTFSFPVNQLSLNSGLLHKWTKGFKASDVEGNDVVELLQKSLAKKNVNVNVVALLLLTGVCSNTTLGSSR
eukprot:Colp12_sorted_trinity150504_noHs@1282